MTRSRMAAALGVLAAALPLGGCLFPTALFDRDRDRESPTIPPQTTPPPQSTARPPSLEIDIADWPPVGPQTGVQVTATDPDGNLSTIEFQFKKSVSRGASGSASSAFVTGSELGEGFGKLFVTATDTTNAFARREVSQMLVDLTPPKIELGQTVLAADGTLVLWVGDAWVLGSVELTFAGLSRKKVFEPGYPDSVGHTWDYSLVKFPMSTFLPGAGAAAVRATDAAGNTVVETFDLVVDGDLPSVSITSPAEGASVSGVFEVQLAASDPGGGPVWVELSLGGTPIATATGPSANLLVDTADLVPGLATLAATARDQAGNATTVTRAIVIQ